MDNLPDEVDAEPVRSLNHAYGAGFIDRQEFVAGVQEFTGQDPPLTEDVVGVAKNVVLLEYIRDLRHRGLKIGLLSNIASNWIRDTLLSPEEQALFDEMVLSYEVGMVKPDPRIFRLVCDRLGVEPAESIMIDDMERYCAAAEDEGMSAVVYRDFKQAKQEIESILNR